MLYANLVPVLGVSSCLLLVCKVLDYLCFKFAREAFLSVTERKLHQLLLL